MNAQKFVNDGFKGVDDMENLKALQAKFKRGWYKKGRSYRFLFAIDEYGFLIYKTKTEVLKKSRQANGINPEMDDWFEKAEYLGTDSPFQ